MSRFPENYRIFTGFGENEITKPSTFIHKSAHILVLKISFCFPRDMQTNSKQWKDFMGFKEACQKDRSQF